jgi:hypothetical protein
MTTLIFLILISCIVAGYFSCRTYDDYNGISLLLCAYSFMTGAALLVIISTTIVTCTSCEYSIKKSSENKNNSVLCSYEYQQDKLYINNSPYTLGIICPSVRLEIKTDKIYLNKKEFKKL